MCSWNTGENNFPLFYDGASSSCFRFLQHFNNSLIVFFLFLFFSWTSKAFILRRCQGDATQVHANIMLLSLLIHWMLILFWFPSCFKLKPLNSFRPILLSTVSSTWTCSFLHVGSDHVHLLRYGYGINNLIWVSLIVYLDNDLDKPVQQFHHCLFNIWNYWKA